jgi:hypothetical protein
LLVEGELEHAGLPNERRVWPTQREVAERLNVSRSTVAEFSLAHQCGERQAACRAGEPYVMHEDLMEDSLPSHFANAPGRSPVSGAPTAATGDEDSRNTAADDEGADDDAESPWLAGEKLDAAERRRRGPGRPHKRDAPEVNIEELDRALVCGEAEMLANGEVRTIYPTFRELADRYGVGPAYIADYARSRNCMKRRRVAQLRVSMLAEEKLIEKRAEAIALAREDVIQMIDAFLLKFAESLREGRVRTDSPADVNTLARLKEFLLGGADSRREVRATLSLEGLQERYERFRQQRPDPQLSGAIDTAGEPVRERAETGESAAEDSESASHPPARGPSCVVSGSDGTEHSAGSDAQADDFSADRSERVWVPRDVLSAALALARRLAESMDAEEHTLEPDLLEVRVLRAVEACERFL